jgi:hypothetical protein
MCVMELASTLAGERFTDHPRSVSPVIAALLREYNDAVDDDRRQALIPSAAQAVGTRGCRMLERARARRCVRWAAEHGGGRRSLWRLAFVDLGGVSLCGARAARVAHSDVEFVALAELLDDLAGPVLTAPAAPAAAPRTKEAREQRTG